MMLVKCTKCVLDSADDQSISFDDNGICIYCRQYDDLEIYHEQLISNKDEELHKLIAKVKNSKKGKYDCVIGLSGGTDSSYLAFLTKSWGLNPLVVHFDNGWNSVLSVKNIKNTLSILNFDLYTHVVDWAEFRDIQRAYFKASVVDIEAPTDHAIGALLFQVAKANKIKYILSGESTFTEGLLPQSWVHNKSDFMNIRDIHRKYGEKKMKTFPHLTFVQRLFMTKVLGIAVIKPLDYVDYRRDLAQQTLKTELNWEDYGGKHEESIFTKFYQSYILPKKFGIDKRKAHLSSLIRAKQMTKEEALVELASNSYSADDLEKDKLYVIKKLGFSVEEFDNLMNQPPISHLQYKSILKWYRTGSKIKRKLKLRWTK